MKRIAAGLAATILVLAAAPVALACNSIVLVPAFPGETEVQQVARWRRAQQDGYRAEADAVFLAQVSAARMMTSWTANYTLTPLFALYETPPVTDDVVMASPVLKMSCDVQPELGGLYIVYADRDGANWSVNHLVRHEDLQDRPSGMPSPRDVARGYYMPPPAD